MSYDIWLETEDMRDNEPGNYTYNVDPMFALAFGEEGLKRASDAVLSDRQPALAFLRDKLAADCCVPLARGIARMEIEPEEYKALNPPNGWGDYEGALDYLRRFRDACYRNPSATVKMWL